MDKHNTGKITLGMIKGKPITTSVPIIHYHASDDELEEFYLSTDEEKQGDIELEHAKLSTSPSKTCDKKNKEKADSKLEQRSLSIDDNLSEGTSQSSDPWKVLSEITGKITKTFEEKLCEIKSEKKKKLERSKENSSISDSEDLMDITPTEGSISDRQEKVEIISVDNTKEDSSRFISFSKVKVGLKTKNSEEDSVESGVEAAELYENFTEATINKQQSDSPPDYEQITATNDKRLHVISDQSLLYRIFFSRTADPEWSLTWLKNELLYQLTRCFVAFFVITYCSYYFIPLPEYILGFIAGVSGSIMVYNTIITINSILSTTPKTTTLTKRVIPVVEIPAVEEHAVFERFEGWLNELPYTYDPQNYHVARTKSVYFRLEGEILRIMETRIRIPKRAVWDEPKHKLKFTRRRTYNLAGAKIELLPEGLIRRRRWSKKYPICITITNGSLVENVALKGSFYKGTQSFQKNTEKTIPEENIDDKINKQKEKEGMEEEAEAEEELEEDEVDVDEEADEDETDEDLMNSRGVECSASNCEDNQSDTCKLYIFARADREKEDWYRRLVTAANYKKRNSVSLITDISVTTSINEVKAPTSSSPAFDRPSELTYTALMNQYLDVNSSTLVDSDTSPPVFDSLWLNCLLGRILFDAHKSSETINLIQDKIQRKLSNIKLPYFMEGLLVNDVILGQKAPVIRDASKPIIDERGLWIDLDIIYKGCLTMTIETKLNLMKLTRAASVSSTSSDVMSTEKSKTMRSPMFDSDVEDSPETSTEENEDNSNTTCSTPKESSQFSGRKFLNMVDKLTANKYFQHATELSYVRKAMKGVSDTEIKLTVSVSGIEGCLSINIPPPPSDRFWYGFKPTPKVTITVMPALGERTVNIGYVTKWIETKLLREFEKLVVLPNMDDLILPLCPNYPYVAT